MEEDKLANVVRQEEEKARDDEGMPVCSVCGKPKKRRIPVPFGMESMVIPCMCDCEIEAERVRREEEERREREALAAKRRKECFSASGFFRGCTFDTDDGRSPKQSALCKRYAETFDVEDPAGLLLWGSVGTGKSFMSSAIANAVIDLGYSALQLDVPYVASIMESSFEKRRSNLDRILGCDLLLVEDLGAQRNTEYMMEHVYTLIDGRYKSGKPMVVTTNFSLSGMLKVSASSPWCRIFDRILERCYPVEFTESSRRKRNALAMQKAMEARLGIAP